tara:strand:- start:58 stop:522 length:465 start_codon:yes stop_codon:yes gene_type:complete
MKTITQEVINFLHRQGFAVVSTLDSKTTIHSAAKGVVGIEPCGRVYLIDLYRGETFKNLKANPEVTLTSVDEHEFSGYALKGKAKIVDREKIELKIIKKWEKQVIDRISQRVIKNIKKDKGSTLHPESRFPQPKYLIVVEIEEIINLAPPHLKK